MHTLTKIVRFSVYDSWLSFVEGTLQRNYSNDHDIVKLAGQEVTTRVSNNTEAATATSRTRQ